MSRIAKKPVIISEGVKIINNDNKLLIEGNKGKLTVAIDRSIDVKIENDQLNIITKNNSRYTKSLSGLYRSLVQNAVIGVTDGYIKSLEIKGVGYRAEVEDNVLVLHLGFSHPINFTIPDNIEITVKKNIIEISGIDKQLVGETAARIRRLKKPEPYKGKGIKYSDEIIRRKVGKAAKAAEGAVK